MQHTNACNTASEHPMACSDKRVHGGEKSSGSSKESCQVEEQVQHPSHTMTGVRREIETMEHYPIIPMEKR
jgi:hypothetical protein